MKVRIVLLQIDKIKFEGSEENNLMSVPGNFSPQELIGHFLWKKRKAGKKSETVAMRGRQALFTPDILLRRPVWLSPNLVYLPQLQKRWQLYKKCFLKCLREDDLYSVSIISIQTQINL